MTSNDASAAARVATVTVGGVPMAAPEAQVFGVGVEAGRAVLSRGQTPRATEAANKLSSSPRGSHCVPRRGRGVHTRHMIDHSAVDGLSHLRV